MGLFKKIQKSDELIRYSIPYSKNFRGFKRFPVSVHGNKEAEKNNKIFCQNDFSNSTFEFVFDNKNDFVGIYIDGLNAGTIFDEDIVNAIKANKIAAIHAEIKSGEERLTYYIKYKE